MWRCGGAEGILSPQGCGGSSLLIQAAFFPAASPSFLLLLTHPLPIQRGLLCDIVLHVATKEIKAHKVVLASCSPYFHAMFTSK
uniref:BTB domain-containing protein n=1 Tax=Catharus ustulatus TaxID=91951 RepID=A0A8C3UAQ7_CATUS